MTQECKLTLFFWPVELFEDRYVAKKDGAEIFRDLRHERIYFE